jgi:hypothetical protein
MLLMSKELELWEDDETLDQTTLTQRSHEDAQKVLDGCMQSLKAATRRMDLPVAPCVKVSGMFSYSFFGWPVLISH